MAGRVLISIILSDTKSHMVRQVVKIWARLHIYYMLPHLKTCTAAYTVLKWWILAVNRKATGTLGVTLQAAVL